MCHDEDIQHHDDYRHESSYQRRSDNHEYSVIRSDSNEYHFSVNRIIHLIISFILYSVVLYFLYVLFDFFYSH